MASSTPHQALHSLFLPPESIKELRADTHRAIYLQESALRVSELKERARQEDPAGTQDDSPRLIPGVNSSQFNLSDDSSPKNHFRNGAHGRQHLQLDHGRRVGAMATGHQGPAGFGLSRCSRSKGTSRGCGQRYFLLLRDGPIEFGAAQSVPSANENRQETTLSAGRTAAFRSLSASPVMPVRPSVKRHLQ